MTVFWPVAAVVILTGFVSSLIGGTRTLLRVLREGSQARQGLFLWSSSLLWYACMCCGGFVFHCLHVRAFAHILDLVGTGLSSLSVIAGFEAFKGRIDDRTPTQRLLLLLCALIFTAVAILSPPLLQEQLYVVPALLAALAGARFIAESSARIRRVGVATRQQEAYRKAQRRLNVAALGVVMGLAVLPLDKCLCVYAGVHFSLLFWFFLGCNLAIFATHQFALVVADNHLYFTDIKAQ